MEFASRLKSFLQNPIFDVSFFGNSFLAYAEALVAFVIIFFVFQGFQSLVLIRLSGLAKRTKTDVDDVAIRTIRTIRPPFYIFLAFYLALFLVELTGVFRSILTAALIIWAVYQSVIAIQIVVDYIVRKFSKGESRETKTAVQSLNLIIKIVLWSLALLLVLSNLGVDITSLIAGLGIGGIAVALAVQNLLGDLFSSFAIYFDKPFKVGDFVVVGKDMGTVERIGIKTTRLRALQGEEIVISNAELTSARIQNFKKMSERRVAFTFGVTYDTSTTKLKKIPELVKSAIEAQSSTRFDRAHFNLFGDSALMFEVVYYLNSNDYNQYMDTQQGINLKLKDAFSSEEIEFAYPTQTIFLAKD